MLVGCFIKLRTLSVLGGHTFKKDNKMKQILEFGEQLAVYGSLLGEGEAFPEPLDSIMFLHELTHFNPFSQLISLELALIFWGAEVVI